MHVVNGDTLTDYYRGLVLEGMWDEAYRSLRAAVPALTSDDTIAILNGNQRLSGNLSTDKTPMLIDDGDHFHRLEIAEIYAGSLFVDRAWYKATAIWADDPGQFPNILSPHHGLPESIIVPVDGKQVVFELAAMPPIWMDPPTTPETAVTQYLEIIGPLPDINAIQYAESQADGAKCGSACIDIQTGEGTSVKVPHDLFTAWALEGTPAAHLAPRPGPVLPEGASLSDALMAAIGVSATANPAFIAALRERRDTVRALYLSRPCATLCGSGVATGRAVHPIPHQSVNPGSILILPNASPDWLKTVLRATSGHAGAVIVEQGGTMSHLVTTCRELGIRIVRDADARRRYPEGVMLRVDCIKQRIEFF